MCTLFLDRTGAKRATAICCRNRALCLWRFFADKFNDKVVAEMRGVIDQHGYSPFWQSLGKRFFSMDFSRADFSAAPGKRHLLQTDAETSDLSHFLSRKPGRHRSGTSANRACPRGAGERRFYVTATISTSSTAGQRFRVTSTTCAPSRKSRLVEVAEGQPAQGGFRPARRR
ncbi:arginine N-succinyltransferase [Shigella flexneri]